MEHPKGESNGRTLRLDFDRCLKLEFHGSKVTSDSLTASWAATCGRVIIHFMLARIWLWGHNTALVKVSVEGA